MNKFSPHRPQRGEVWNGRIFSPLQGVDKGHNFGSTAGMAWFHPGITYDPNKPTYVTEGVIDALSLIEMGLQAIAILSAGQDPRKVALGAVGEKLVLALDPDSAEKGLKTWKAAYPGAGAIVPLRGDWNDLLRSSPPGKARERFDADYRDMERRARLALSETAKQYAEIWLEGSDFGPGLYEFGGCLWWLERADKSGEVHPQRVTNFRFTVDHYLLDCSSHENPVYQYCIKVFPKNGQPRYCNLSGSDLSSPNKLSAAMATNACSVFNGNEGAVRAYRSKVLESSAPIVRQVHLLGHDQSSGCIVFPNFLIDAEGEMHLPDGRGFLKASHKEYLKPPTVQPCVTPKSSNTNTPARIYQLFAGAWPKNGLLVVAYTIASWFVWVVKPELGFFPFLSLHGDTQTGKTHAVRRCNAMQCLDEEGLPMTKLNTGKGEIRKLAQRSGLFWALLEGNKEEKVRFEMESLLVLYNYGNPLQVRAVKSNDLATRSIDFNSSLIFVQNKEPFKSKAQMERVVSSLPFKTDDITEETTRAFRELLKVPLREMGQCYLTVMKCRRQIEAEWYNEYIKARDAILETVPDNRIAENHAVLLGFHRIAEKIFGVKYDLAPVIGLLAMRKHQQCTHQQATEADGFFEACMEMNKQQLDKFMHIQGGRIYVRLRLALKLLDGVGFKFFGSALEKALKEHPSFLDSNRSHRAYWGSDSISGGSESVKCWIFDAEKALDMADDEE